MFITVPSSADQPGQGVEQAQWLSAGRAPGTVHVIKFLLV